jgi:hypothetical protein
MKYQPLRLKAEDAADLSVIAACLQDALIPLSEMVYLAEEGRFLAAFTRFRRECLQDPERCDGLTQCQSVLAFEGVRSVHHHGIDTRFGAVRLELLTLVATPAGSEGLDVVLVFAGDMAIRIRVDALRATLRDFGEPHPAGVTPRHDPLLEPASSGGES